MSAPIVPAPVVPVYDTTTTRTRLRGMPIATWLDNSRGFAGWYSPLGL